MVDELIKDGWLVREHGRGMFVGAPKIAQEICAVPGAGVTSGVMTIGNIDLFIWMKRLTDWTGRCRLPASIETG